MILALLLLAQAAPPPAAPSPDADEVVVIANRLRGWSGTYRDTLGIKTCRTKTSTGDAEIDRIGCSALLACFAPARTKLEAATKAAGRDKAARAAAVEPINREMTACFKERRTTMIAELVAARRARKRG